MTPEKRMHRHPDEAVVPEWVAGLLIAVVLALAVLLGIRLLGVGDDPSFATSTTPPATSTTDPG